MSFTPTPPDELRRLAAEEESRLDETWAALELVAAAASEPGFSGQLRRAILSARIPPDELADRIGVDCATLQSFRRGEGSLTTTAVDRLMDELGLALAPVATGH